MTRTTAQRLAATRKDDPSVSIQGEDETDLDDMIIRSEWNHPAPDARLEAEARGEPYVLNDWEEFAGSLPSVLWAGVLQAG